MYNVLDMVGVFALLVIFQIKHFVADYPLQGKYMLKKFLPGWDFVLPLTAHAGVHALITLVILVLIKSNMYWLVAVDFVVHFIVDRIKASPKMLGRFKALSAVEFRLLFTTPPRKLGEGVAFKYVTEAEVAEAIRDNTFFWWALGWDQMMHHLTHYFIIWMLVS